MSQRVFPLLFSLLLFAPFAHADEPKGGPPEFKELKFRSIGPSVGGRVCRSCGVPGDPLTYYAAVSSGGVWKSSDGGLTWKPIFDDQPTQAIGSIAVAPSDPNVIYVGSGEANIRNSVQPGNGIYRSTDAGKTWKHVWKSVGQIGTIIVHPKNPDIAFAAVLGSAFAPNEERGVYRTIDGGTKWQRVLYKDVDTGASDVCFDPNNPRILFAGMWQARRRPWELTSGGPGSGLYTSRDGGDTWTQLVPTPKDEQEPPEKTKFCDGLPELLAKGEKAKETGEPGNPPRLTPYGLWGRVSVGVARSDSKRVYAMIEAEKGGLFRSDDGGDSWSLVNDGRGIRQRAWYFSTLTIHPKNADIVYCPQVPLLKSIDGGKTFARVKGPHHGDHHDMWIDPDNPERMIDSNDGGVDISTNGGQTWYAPPLPIGQFYHVRCDTQTPYHVSGCVQDIDSVSGPSNSLASGGISLSDWHSIGGGEAGFTAPDPGNPNIVYAGEYGGFITRYDHRTRQAQSIGIYPFNVSGYAAADLKYRFQWTAPILVSPHDPKVVYHAANVLFKTSDAGRTWEKISPDLSGNFKPMQQWSGGPITGDNTGAEIHCTISALAESPKQKDLLWAGTDDCEVHVSSDGGKNWKKARPGAGLQVPGRGVVACIEPSPFEAESAYLVIDNHRMGDNNPYLYHTTDAGKTWTEFRTGLPRDMYLRVIREDPKKKGQLYVGTSNGVWFSQDAGKTWQQLKLNFPAVQVSDLIVKDDDLVVGTEGRSIWIFDDLTPLRQVVLSPPEKKKKPKGKEDAPVDGKKSVIEIRLLEPPPAYRYRYHGNLHEPFDRSAADNPPQGAIIHYFLKTKPKNDVVLEILDANEKLVRKLTSKEEEKEESEPGDYSDAKEEKTALPNEAGLHRFVWDLRYTGATPIKKAKVDGGNPKSGPLVLPGTYTLKLSVEGQTATTKLVVKQDPRVKLPDEELAKQLELILKIRDDISDLGDAVNQVRSVRRQVQERNEALKDDKKADKLVKAGEALVKKIDAVEESLHNPKAKISYDILAQKGGAKLYSQLASLFDQLKDSDGEPTQGIREVYAEQRQLLESYRKQWRDLTAGDLARLNELARTLERSGIIVPAGRAE